MKFMLKISLGVLKLRCCYCRVIMSMLIILLNDSVKEITLKWKNEHFKIFMWSHALWIPSSLPALPIFKLYMTLTGMVKLNLTARLLEVAYTYIYDYITTSYIFLIKCYAILFVKKSQLYLYLLSWKRQ
jgi:hypothetical protein